MLSLLAVIAAMPAAWAQSPDGTGAQPAPSILTADARSNARVTGLDGTHLRAALTAKGAGVRQFMLMPGMHVLTGEMATESGRAPFRVEWTFEPGKSYVLYTSLRGYRVQAGIAERGSPRPSFEPPAEAATSPVPAAEADASPAQAAATNQEATLTLEPNDALTVTSLDGKKTVVVGFWNAEHPREFKLKPGKHLLEAELRIPYPYPGSTGFSGLWFVAEPGRAYRVWSESHGSMFNIWVEDEAGQRVGGIQGSEDEPAS